MADLYVISGVAGMTGNELSRQLIASGNRVIGFDNLFASSVDTLRDSMENKQFVFLEYDINHNDQMADIENRIEKEKTSYNRLIYINCAAVVHTEHFYHVNRTFDTNVLGMRSFLEQAVRQQAYAYINCSTSEVYSMASWNERGGVSEEDYILLANAEHSQRTSYATGKLLTEFFMRDAVNEGKIRGCSLRFANVYSRNELYPKHIIPYILTSLLKDGSVTLLENSRKNRRTFLHNYDSCAAVLALLETEAALDGSVYNIATDEEVSIIDLVHMCAELAGVDKPEIKFEGYRESDPERRLLSTEKIRSKTTWQPQITLREGIRMCVEEMKKGS